MSVQTVNARASIQKINEIVRTWLRAPDTTVSPLHTLVTGRDGPLWYRGYFPKYSNGEETAKEIDAVKEFYGVERIAVGHTIVPTVTSLCNGSVIAVQVYPTKDKATGQMNMEGVYIDEQGTWHKAKIDGTREPLEDDKGGIIRNTPPQEPVKKAA